MTFDKIKPGMTLYDVHKYTMGNTSLRSIGVWPVSVITVHEDRTIIASWNGNKPTRMYERQWSKYRLKKPELVRGNFGTTKLKPRTAHQSKAAP